jgi:hypothetical protein
MDELNEQVEAVEPSWQSTSSGENPPGEQPLIAAFEAGRCINRITFHTLQAWLLACPDQARQAAAAYEDLAITVRDLTVNVEVREWLSDQIRQRQTDSGSRLRSQEHAGFISDVRSTPDGFDQARQEAELEGLILRRKLLGIVERVLSPHGYILLRFGEFVDQVLRPTDIVNEIEAARISRMRLDQAYPVKPEDLFPARGMCETVRPDFLEDYRSLDTTFTPPDTIPFKLSVC